MARWVKGSLTIHFTWEGDREREREWCEVSGYIIYFVNVKCKMEGFGLEAKIEWPLCLSGIATLLDWVSALLPFSVYVCLSIILSLPNQTMWSVRRKESRRT